MDIAPSFRPIKENITREPYAIRMTVKPFLLFLLLFLSFRTSASFGPSWGGNNTQQSELLHLAERNINGLLLESVATGGSGVSKNYVAKWESIRIGGSQFKLAVVALHLKAFPTDAKCCAKREAQAAVARIEVQKLSSAGVPLPAQLSKLFAAF